MPTLRRGCRDQLWINGFLDLKRRLVQTCNGDIDAYVDGKDVFVKDIERRALEWVSKRD